MPRDWEPEDRDHQPDIWHSGRMVEISEAGLDFVKVLKCIHCGAIAPYATLCIPRREKRTAAEADDEDFKMVPPFPGYACPSCERVHPFRVKVCR